MKNGTNISCKRTLPCSLMQKEMWRAPSLTPVLHITKIAEFFSPSLMSYLLHTCLPLLIPQLLNNHKSRRKNHDECNIQKQFMAIFNLPFGLLSPWDSFCSHFLRFSSQQSEIKNIFSYKMSCVFSFFFFYIITRYQLARLNTKIEEKHYVLWNSQ